MVYAPQLKHGTKTPLLTGSGPYTPAIDPSCCCPVPDPTCGGCLSGTVPSEMQVVLSGWAPGTNNPSDCCNDINGTYILTYGGTVTLPSGQACLWTYTLPGDLCPGTTAFCDGPRPYDVKYLILWITNAGPAFAGWSAALFIGSVTSGVAQYQQTFAFPFDCSLPMTLPFAVGSTCTGSVCNYNSGDQSVAVTPLGPFT
jgi:hypothetical protein